MRPVFIVGCERSGTTLLRLMLNAHSRLAIPPESNFIPDCCKYFRNRAPYDAQTLKELMQLLESFPGFQDFKLSREELLSRWQEMSKPSLGDLLNVLYLLYAQRDGKSRWGDKTPGYAEQIRRLDQLFPECQVIHLIRDPRDVVLSMIRGEVGQNMVYAAAQQWVGRVTAARRDGQQILGAKRYLEVHYEDLVIKPRQLLPQIVQFLGEPMEEGMLAFDQRVGNLIPAREHHRHQSALGKLTTGRVNQWRGTLSHWQILQIEAVAGSQLTAFGYTSVPSPFRVLLLPVFGIQRLGWWSSQIPGKLIKWLGKRAGQIPTHEA